MSHSVELDYVRKDGSTLRQHYEMVEKLSGKKQEILIEPKFNKASWYLLETFFELGSTRTSGMNGGMNSISYSEIKAYTELAGDDFEPWEVAIIKTLDRTYINAVYKAREEDTTQ